MRQEQSLPHTRTAGSLASVDLLKGLLLTLVIVGHFPTLSASKLPWKYTLYAVHMPLFLAVSGYLLRREKLRATSLLALLQHYWWRMVLPWSLVAAGMVVARKPHLLQSLPSLALLREFTKPYYHLWYVPTLLLMIIALWLLERVRSPWWSTMAVGFGLWYWWQFHPGPVQKWADYHFSSFLVRYFPYLVLGYLLRNEGWRGRWMLLGLPVGALGVAWYATLFPGGTVLSKSLLLVLNTALILAVTEAHRAWPQLRLPVLNWVGQNSLPVYLLHPPLLFALQRLGVHQRAPMWYVLSGVVLIAGLMAVLRLLSRYRVAQVLLFGRG